MKKNNLYPTTLNGISDQELKKEIRQRLKEFQQQIYAITFLVSVTLIFHSLVLFGVI